MSIDAMMGLQAPDHLPELTPLGKRLEILRIERGVSKQRLARHANTSRQQLWRVMTGKSELTASLRERLAAALAVDSAALVHPVGAGSIGMRPGTFSLASLASAPSVTIAEFLGDAAHLTATVRTLPGGEGGRRLKRALLTAVEDLAFDSGQALSSDYAEMRRRVLAGEL